MPFKRGRRSSSVSEESTSVTDYNEDSLQSATSSISTRKRRKLINSKLEVCHCQEILDKLRTIKADDGHFITDSFLRLPNKRSASDYYDVITSPIDLTKIGARITSNEYNTFLDFEIDIEQLVDNAKMYHTSSAMEYQDAVVLWTVYEQEKQNMATKASIKAENMANSSQWSQSRTGNDTRSRRSRKRIAISVDDGLSDQISLATSDDSRNTSEIGSVSDNPMDAFFTSVVLQRTDSGKDIMPTFTFLPSRIAYPQYYEVTKEPIDLRLIAKKIKNSTYNGIEELERDFNVMIKNAKAFNEPKSEVYQDAIELQKIIKNKRLSYDQGNKPQKRRGRHRKIPMNLADQFSEMISPKESEDESSEPIDEHENSVEDDKDLEINPGDINRVLQWQLYKAVTSAIFINDTNPTEHFMKLPSKKLYPEYYLEIVEPMSLLMVKSKIKDNVYRDVDDTLRDLNLVFNNAQQFNVEDSDIYKDAVKLQHLANMKRAEIMRQTLQYSKDIQVKKAPSSISKSNQSTPVTSTPRRTRPPISPEELRVKRIINLFQAIYSYQEDNRFLRDIFMSLPSKELYPKYYEVIPNPTDLTIIRKKIDDNKYQSHLNLVEDLQLMFSNAKHFNEESSQIYKDTLTFEKILKKKIKSFGVGHTGTPRGPKKKSDSSATMVSISSPVFVPPMISDSPHQRMREIFQTMREYRNIGGRLLSDPFVKLPAKSDMPEYYEYIKKPLEIPTILSRINSEKYRTVDELMEDLVLMFDNACKFNEPDSQLYRDAVILHRVCVEKKSFLSRDDNLSEAPNVQNLANDIMLTMYRQFFNCTDEDGRYLVDSIRGIETDLITRKPAGQNPNTSGDSITESVRLNLDIIKNHLEKRRYKRLDRLQDDVFSYLKHVRKVSEVSSQAFEDACKLQKAFMSIRDDECERGEILLSTALNYGERYFNQEIEQEIKERKITNGEEVMEDDREFMENTLKDGSYRILNSVTRQDNNYQVGEFVRIQTDPNESPRIGEICAVLVPNSDDIQSEDNNSDGTLIRVNWFYLPHQTKHKSTKRIIEKEVFQTSVYVTVPLNKVISKCLVMYIKDYVKQTSKNFNEIDIFVCEMKYFVKDDSFKKLKNMVYKLKSISDSFVNRDESLILARNMSSDEATFSLNDFLFPLDNVKESVVKEDGLVKENCVYYDQIVCDNGFSVKVGDYVYVNDELNRKQIIRVDQLWKNIIDKVVYFLGSWFINAMDIEHLPTRMFYRKEVLLSSVDGTNQPLTAILGKCVILTLADYCKYRPIDYTYDDVFCCQFKYFFDEKIERKLTKGLKKAQLSIKASDDELYFFKKELVISKIPSPMLTNYTTEPIRQEYIMRIMSSSHGPLHNYIDEDSKDTSMTLDDSVCSMSVASSGNTGSVRKGKKKKIKKAPSGYVLYAGEVRKQLYKENPDAEFGLISKEVGQMWRNIPQTDKDVYERRAHEIKKKMEKETAIVKEQERIQNETLMKQQGQQPNAPPQQMFVANAQIQNQRNYIQVTQPNQQIMTTTPNTFPNNAPIQYFQTSNGQVLQFMPSTNVQSNVPTQFTAPGAEQHLQFMQQPNGNSQQVIYQINQQAQANQQSVLGNQAQFMMHQNKIAPFQTAQAPINQQTGQLPPNMANINFSPMQQAQAFSGFQNLQANIPTNMQYNQNFNAPPIQAAAIPQAPQHFISMPTKSNRLLHSDIYQKYIDKLRKNATTLSDWKQQLELSKESILISGGGGGGGGNQQSYVNRLCQDVAPAFLDGKLLADKDGKKASQEAIVDCLFQLRDHMLQDAMNIRTQVLGIEEL